MESFYGGPKGKDFEIKQVFTSKYQMDRDLTKGWTSPIFPGDLVIVSYGLPSDTNYDVYKDEDLRAYGKSYNSTLWRKIFIDAEGTGSAGGLSYEMLASMTGNTPRIDITEPEVLDADQDPDVRNDSTDLDNVLLTFLLPQAQVIGGTTVQVLDCDQQPYVSFIFTLDEGEFNPNRTYFQKIEGKEEYNIISLTEEDYESDRYYYLENINHPVIRFAVPQSQVIENATVTYLKANQSPTVSVDTTNINRPTLQFQLPVAQTLQQGDTTILDADGDPSFNINFDDIDHPVIHFSLPQSQVMGDPETTWVGPEEQVDIELDDSNINQPILKFKLPEAVKFYYGNLLGERTAGTYTIPIASGSFNVGDYYINEATGFIYKITAATEIEYTATYVACIQSPLPDVEVDPLDPYTNGESGYETTTPTVTREFTNDEETAWKLVFGLPTAVEHTVSFTFIGADEEGSVTSEIVSATTQNINFQIPAGAKIYAGTETSSASGMKNGDIFLNSETGQVYKYNGTSWIEQEGTLKGPIGNALNIEAEYQLTESEDYPASLENGSAYIEENYTGEIDASKIFAVTWTLIDGGDISYWYFKTEAGAWARAQLTGGVSGFIENAYATADNKTYSVDYINSLIEGTTSQSGKMTTYSKEKIDELLSALDETLNTWGTFAELPQ